MFCYSDSYQERLCTFFHVSFNYMKSTSAICCKTADTKMFLPVVFSVFGVMFSPNIVCPIASKVKFWTRLTRLYPPRITEACPDCLPQTFNRLHAFPFQQWNLVQRVCRLLLMNTLITAFMSKNVSNVFLEAPAAANCFIEKLCSLSLQVVTPCKANGNS